MNNLSILALAKGYTDETVIGGGAIKGKNCTIQSIEPVSVGNKITFLWTLDDGTERSQSIIVTDGTVGFDDLTPEQKASLKGDKGDKGDKGIGVKDAYVDENNHLIIEFDDGSEHDAGAIVVTALDELAEMTDVDIDSPTDGQVLVYDAEEEKWKNADNQSGTSDYPDLTNKPQIEGITLNGNKTASALGLAKTTDLAGFITKTVDDLVNYYTKSQTYSKTEVDTIVTAIKNGRFEVVASLPTTDIKTNVIYLVPSADPQVSNVKDEYINLDGTTAGWEIIGSTAIDLTGYVTESELNTALADYTTTTDLTALLASKQDKTQYSTLPTASAELEGKIVEYTGVTGSGLTHGYFYECVSDGESTPTYSWQQTNVQPSGGGSTVLSQTLTTGSTSVTFTGIPTTGNHLVDFYTSNGINYKTIDTSIAGQVTITFDAQQSDVTVFCEIKEVTV